MSGFINSIDALRNASEQSELTRIQRFGKDLTFSDVLKARLEQKAGVAFSAHTIERLRERGIELGNEDLQRLAQAVNRADEKGANNSLVVMDNTAFIVSIKNRTVVTAMTGDTVKDHVFTNIDSTVFA